MYDSDDDLAADDPAADAAFDPDADLEAAHVDLASAFPPALGPTLEHGYAWRCRGTDTESCPEAHSGTTDWTDSGIEVCPRHGSPLEYRLP
jgi:hypothetical protein